MLLLAVCAWPLTTVGEVTGRSSDATPEALVREFYEKYPHELDGGLPEGEDLEWLSTYISERLYERFRSALAYQQNWIRQNPDRPPYFLKPPFADGVHFTGAPDAIDSFVVLGTDRRPSGAWCVRIRFLIDSDSDGWEAMAIVIEERSRYVIDDIEFQPSEPGGIVLNLFDSLDTTSSN